MRAPLSALAVGFVMVAAVTTSYVVAPSSSSAAPAVTAVATLGVIIPASGSATPSPTPSRTTTGGGTTGGGATGGGETDGDIELPTKADGTPIPPNAPTEGADGLTLDRETVSADEWIVATGTGYKPGEKVQFVLYPGAVVIGSFVAGSSGTVTARFKITSEARPGTYVVEATGWESFRVTNETFRVVSVGDAGVFPFLWWVLVVLGVILASLLATGLYFRRTIRSWFSGTPAGAMS